MNLVVDIGNTRVKYAVFEKKRMVIDQNSETSLFLNTIKEIFEVYPSIGHAIISSVGEYPKKEFELLSLFCKVHLLSHTSKIPFKNSYINPQTLGMDRIALAAAAFYKNPNENTLVIDMGTCITYEMLNDYGEYLGGAISPGMQMRFTAMNQYTKKLPLVEPENILDFIGNSTEKAMQSGVINGIAQEVDGVINQYKDRFEFLTVILTGGDAHFFVKRLKNSIFANSKFLLEGLNYLLEYNKN